MEGAGRIPESLDVGDEGQPRSPLTEEPGRFAMPFQDKFQSCPAAAPLFFAASRSTSPSASFRYLVHAAGKVAHLPFISANWWSVTRSMR